MTVLLVVLLPGITWLILLTRITALRKNRYGDDSYFANPGRYAMLLHEVFDKDVYTDEGKKLLPWLKVNLVALIVSFFAFLWLIA